jgi:coenzyme F420-0:L-glutamate ligase/coenzyme F420-1:gamma-L-glutamate ligase
MLIQTSRSPQVSQVLLSLLHHRQVNKNTEVSEIFFPRFLFLLLILMKQADPVQIFPILKIPLIHQGDDLVDIILDAINVSPTINSIEDNDIICIGQKIVSKAYGCIYNNYRNITPTESAKALAQITEKSPEKIQIILDHAIRLVRIGKDLLITENENLLVGANSGIDFSNTEYPTYLHPDCDLIAREIRNKIQQKTGKRIGVIITDSIGRPFRFGSVGFAAGSAGIKVLEDKRGTKDIFGNTLQHTFIAVADQLATMADAVMGQCDEKIPAVIIRNANFVSISENSKAKDLRRPTSEDTFIQFPWNYLFKYKISAENNIDKDFEIKIEDIHEILTIIIASIQIPGKFDYRIEKGEYKNQFHLIIQSIEGDEAVKEYILGKIETALELYLRGLGLNIKVSLQHEKLEIKIEKPKNFFKMIEIEKQKKASSKDCA